MNTESVDLVYLDPPFNSNKNYAAPIGSEAAGAAFKDTWTLSDVDEAWHGEIAEHDPALYGIIDAAGKAHGKGMKSYLIMMAVRLLEMKRLLKDTGSIYLHCDPTASHYLKLLMDAIFGWQNFVNEIVWQYDGPQRPSRRRFGSKHDVIFRYSKTDNYFSDPDGIAPFQPLGELDLYRYKQLPDGRYFYTTPRGDYTDSSVDRLDAEDRIEYTKSGNVRIRHFLPTDSFGKVGRAKQLPDVWTDIISLGHAGGNEKVGYPTQKPVALLERIIKSSSHEDDIVLDPFCGCATACLAAEKHHRQWVGIDISAKAFELVKARMHRELGLFGNVIHRTDIPQRTDQGPVVSYKTHKHTLFGKQEGVCNGCRHSFQFRNFTIDHVVPQAKGGTDHFDNLQLLCGACNSMKGAGTQEALIAKLKQEGIR